MKKVGGIGSGLTGLGGISMAGQSYIDKILGIQAANLIAYWPLNETSGTNADNAEGTGAYDGTYTGVTLNNITGPDGVNGAPLFDGVNDVVALPAAALDTPFDGALGSACIWSRVFNSAVYNDGTDRNMFEFGADANNRVYYYKFNTGNNVFGQYIAGGTSDFFLFSSQTSVDWVHWAITWSAVADEINYYRDGVQTIPDTGLGVFAGALSAAFTAIGDFRSAGGGSPWYGWLAHCAVWNTVLTPAQITDLATI